MMIELDRLSLNVIAQHSVKAHYDGKVVGDFVADILVDDTMIVELKSVRHLNKSHETQLVNYLVATGKPVGLLLNFGEEKVEVKRKGLFLKQSWQSRYPVKKKNK